MSKVFRKKVDIFFETFSFCTKIDLESQKRVPTVPAIFDALSNKKMLNLI